jgi:hypothetical protein
MLEYSLGKYNLCELRAVVAVRDFLSPCCACPHSGNESNTWNVPGMLILDFTAVGKCSPYFARPRGPLGNQQQTAHQKRLRQCCTWGGPRRERATSPPTPYLVPNNWARYCVGDWPRIFLNTRLKCVSDWNPTSKAISLTRRFGLSSKFLDFSMRTRER